LTKNFSLKLLLVLMLISFAYCAPSGAVQEEPQVIVYHQGSAGSAQFEVISPKGVRIFIDVYNHELLTGPAKVKDILLTTHLHTDHLDDTFYPGFPGEQLFFKTGKIVRDDVVITSIPASHGTIYGTFDPQNPSNYFFLIETGGLRIAHLGGMGQEKFLPEQLTALGKIDLVMAPFSGTSTGMNVSGKKGFNLMQELKPRLIIPTHNGLEEAKYMAALWKCSYTEGPLRLGRSKLTDETRVLFLGEPGRIFAKVLNLPNTPF
jgi:L-ascorbate metabolism protein UlaG (beta-lactamase superfamily)